MKKNILCSIILSIFSFSSFSYDLPIVKTENSYLNLNNEIKKNDNESRQKTFEYFYNNESDNINKKVSFILHGDKYISNEYSNNESREEKILLDKQNLISSFYLRQGFVDESKKNNISEKNAEKTYNKINKSVLDNSIQDILNEKPIDNNDYSAFFKYNKTGILVSSYHILSDIHTACPDENQECIVKIINKRKNIHSDDIFENLTNQCLLELSNCRTNIIKSDVFQRKINYNNYLIGSYLFDYYSKINKK